VGKELGGGGSEPDRKLGDAKSVINKMRPNPQTRHSCWGNQEVGRFENRVPAKAHGPE